MYASTNTTQLLCGRLVGASEYGSVMRSAAAAAAATADYYSMFNNEMCFYSLHNLADVQRAATPAAAVVYSPHARHLC